MPDRLTLAKIRYVFLRKLVVVDYSFLTLHCFQADWMLTVITSEAEGVDYVEDFLKSQQYETMQTDIKNTIEEDGKDPDKKITFSNTFAASRRTRSNLLAKRLRTIYWRR